MITDEYFQREYDRLIKLLLNTVDDSSWWGADRQLYLKFVPQQGKESLCTELRFQLDVIQTARSLTYYNELTGRDPDDGCGSVSDKKQSFVLEVARGIEWR